MVLEEQILNGMRSELIEELIKLLIGNDKAQFRDKSIYFLY